MRPFATILIVARKHGALRWLISLGGPGLILLGIADNSVIPLPGSMDVFTIWLAAYHRNNWFYYAILATIGSLVGGYITYRLAAKGGKEAIEKKFSRNKLEKVYSKFESWGFWAVAVPALLPPPFPIVPALAAAGALQFPRKRFLTALAFGRGVRYTIVGFLGAHYGTPIVHFFSQYYKPALFTLIGLAVLAGIAGYIEYRRVQKGHTRDSHQRHTEPGVHAA